MIKCSICGKDCKSLRSITKHIQMLHKLVSKDVLFETNKELFNECKICLVPIKFYKTDSQSRHHCSKECYIKSKKNKKQSSEVINKRIKNTNQIEKQKTRAKTMESRYGKQFYCNDMESRNKKLSEKLTGKKRSPEHVKKTIDSKRLNGTLKHSQKTKDLISKKLLATFGNPNYDKSKFVKPKKNGYKTCNYKGFFVRSSYEKKFIDFCDLYKLKVVSAENNKFSVKYCAKDGRIRTYFPDFYVEDLDLIVEIKPISMYDYKDNIAKFDAMLKVHRFVVITEDDYLLDEEMWYHLYDELLLA